MPTGGEAIRDGLRLNGERQRNGAGSNFLKTVALDDLHALQRTLIVELVEVQRELSYRYDAMEKKKGPATLLGRQHLMDLNGVLESELSRLEKAFPGR